MNIALKPVEPVTVGIAFEDECAFCGIGSLSRPTWVYCEDCQQQHAICPNCAKQARTVEGERA